VHRPTVWRQNEPLKRIPVLRGDDVASHLGLKMFARELNHPVSGRIHSQQWRSEAIICWFIRLVPNALAGIILNSGTLFIWMTIELTGLDQPESVFIVLVSYFVVGLPEQNDGPCQCVW
jgi:hypothetical protein